MRELVITQALLDKALMHARHMRPNEACGLLLGDGERVKAVKPMLNANPSPVSYSLEPREQLMAMKEAEASGLRIMGIYHSHPASPAMPSLTDIERAFFPGTREPNFPGAAYMIIGLMSEVPDVKAYLIEPGEVRRLEIKVVRNYNDHVLAVQFPLVREFVYHLNYYRMLWTAYNNAKLKSEFWKYTIDAHLLRAVMLWCMVFGSDGSNDTHWKKLLIIDRDKLIERFRNRILDKTGLTAYKWSEYHIEVRGFRDKLAAHSEGYDKPIPKFDIALQVAYCYYDWVIEDVAPNDSFGEPHFEELYKSLEAMQPSLDKLVASYAELL